MKNLKNTFFAISTVCSFAFPGADASAKALSELIDAGEEIKGVSMMCRSLDSGVGAHDAFRFSTVVFIDMDQQKDLDYKIEVETSAVLDLEVPTQDGERERVSTVVEGVYSVGQYETEYGEPLKLDLIDLGNQGVDIRVSPKVGKNSAGRMVLRQANVALDLSCRIAAIK